MAAVRDFPSFERSNSGFIAPTHFSTLTCAREREKVSLGNFPISRKSVRGSSLSWFFLFRKLFCALIKKSPSHTPSFPSLSFHSPSHSIIFARSPIFLVTFPFALFGSLAHSLAQSPTRKVSWFARSCTVAFSLAHSLSRSRDSLSLSFWNLSSLRYQPVFPSTGRPPECEKKIGWMSRGFPSPLTHQHRRVGGQKKTGYGGVRGAGCHWWSCAMKIAEKHRSGKRCTSHWGKCGHWLRWKWIRSIMGRGQCCR